MKPNLFPHLRQALLILYLLCTHTAFAQQNVQSWSGTAFAITDNGYLATNAHVIDKAISISVSKDGVKRAATVVAVDHDNDLAILKVDANSQPLYVDGERRVRKGADVSTLGFPNIGIQGNESKFTSGQINSESGVMNDLRFYQISVPIQPGNSGGPLMDSSGTVVGIVTSKLRTSQAMIANGDVPQNVSYALKARYLLAMLESLQNVKEHVLKAPPSAARNNEDIAAMADNAVFLVLVTKPTVAPPPVFTKLPAVPYNPSGPGPMQPADTKLVKIGHVGPISGALAHLGIDNENGARLAIEELNASNVSIGGERIWFQLVPKDDAADPGKATTVARELVAEGVSGVIGHLNSGTTIPASKVYADAGIVQISPSATNPNYTMQGYATAFRVTPSDQSLARFLAMYVVDNVKPARVVIVDDATAYGQGVAATFAGQVPSSGAQVVDRVRVSNRQTDFADIAANIQMQAPDLVFFGGMDSTAGALLSALHRQGLDPYFVGADGVCTDRMGTLADNPGKVICGQAGGVRADSSSAFQAFKDRYRRRFSSEPQIFSPNAYDAVKLMVEAMKQANSTDPHVYVNALHRIQYRGVIGQYQFDSRGDLQYPTISVYQYSGNRRMFKTVYPQ